MRNLRRRLGLAIVTLLLLFTTTIGQAAAWGFVFPGPPPMGWDGPIPYCVRDLAKGSVAYNTAHSAVQRWNTLANRGSNGPGYFIHDCFLASYNLYFPTDTSSVSWYGGTGPYWLSGGHITGTRTDINMAHDWWKYGADQNCHFSWTTQPGCQPDFFTAVMHEAGHALGIGHNTTSGTDRCNGGYYSTQSLAACDYYGEAVMHWSAGVERLGTTFTNAQGYRHLYPSTDDQGAYDVLYP